MCKKTPFGIRSTLVLLGLLTSGGVPAHAGDMTVTGPNMNWDAATGQKFVVGIENSTNTSELLTGWQLGLEIDPGTGATGTLRFNSVSLPSDYLLEGRSQGLTGTYSLPNTSITAIGDNDSFATGVSVLASGKNLLQLGFSADTGTQGPFNVKLVPGISAGAWITSPPNYNTVAYQNAPFGGGPVQIGTVTVSPVPEPATWVALAGLALIAIPWAVGHCRRARQAEA